MKPRLVVVSPGALSSIQDQGRFGWRRFGVPQSGVVHPPLALIANTLAGNPIDTPLIEFFLSGPRLHLKSGTIRLALAGDFSVELVRGQVKHSLPSWRSLTLYAGDTLQIGAVTRGKVGYLALSGGLDLPRVMGSRSTYLRGNFGGLDGHRLLTGSELPVGRTENTPGPEQFLTQLPGPELLAGVGEDTEDALPLPIRVIMGPQEDYFPASSREDFLTGSYQISKESDRMGSRLEGPILHHLPWKKPEIISDGVVPGAIQVPGNGSPIVMLADGPTVGGYPKIATVISVDLPKFAALPPGSKVVFSAVTSAAAEGLLRRRRDEMAELLKAIKPLIKPADFNNHPCPIVNRTSH